MAALAIIPAGAAIQKNQEAVVATSIASPAILVAASAKTAVPPAAAAIASPVHSAIDATPATSNDRRRSWLWSFLAVVAASQLYFFRELLAAFAIFAIAFAVVALVVVSFYMLVKCGEVAVARLAQFREPTMQVNRLAGNGQPYPRTSTVFVQNDW